MEVIEVDEFKKSVKKLKKFRNLREDINRLKLNFVKGEWDFEDYKRKYDLKRYQNLGLSQSINIYKLRKFQSTDLRGKNTLRIILYWNFTQEKVYFFIMGIHQIDNDTVEGNKYKATIIKILKDLKVI